MIIIASRGIRKLGERLMVEETTLGNGMDGADGAVALQNIGEAGTVSTSPGMGMMLGRAQ